MNNKYTTSLELSKKLKEAGVEQKSEYKWKVGIDSGHPNLVETHGLGVDLANRFFEYYSSFLTDELLELLPQNIDLEDLECLSDLSIEKADKDYRVLYNDWDDVVEGYDFYDESLPNALAKMVLHLAEQGLLKKGNHE